MSILPSLPSVSVPGLGRLLNRSLSSKGHKVLYTAPDVTKALGDFIPPAWHPILTGTHGSAVGALAFLTGIDIIEAEDAAPGWFRLVHHDGCEVKGKTVYHGKCTIVAEGTVDLTTRRPYEG